MTEWLDFFRDLVAPGTNVSVMEWTIRVFLVVTTIIAIGAALSFAVRLLVKQAAKTATDWDDVLLQSLRLPLTLLIWIVGLTYVAEWFWDTSAHAELLTLAANVRALGVIFCLVLFLLRFLKGGEDVYLRRKQARDEYVDLAGVRAVNKLLKASVIITGVLMVLNTMGYSISGVLAFGGIGGIAVGFAAKDLLSNFFGGLMVYLDRPFIEGDWIRSPDRDIEGTVEHIGWRQTRIRSFARYPIYVPNSVFAQITIENPSRMECRRIHEVVGVRYDDLAKVGEMTKAIREMLQNHPEIDSGKTLIVNLNRFNDSSLDIMVYTYTRTTEWVNFHEVQQDVMLKVAEVVERCGGEIAFPTRTLHWAGEGAGERHDKNGTTLRSRA